MRERTFTPNSQDCERWEARLTDALDGLLSQAEVAAYSEHRTACPKCAELSELAQQGGEWLKYLAVEPELPAGLLDKILAQTGPGVNLAANLGAMGSSPRLAPAASTTLQSVSLPQATSVIPAWQHPGVINQVRRYAEPRLLSTMAMAFFSIALTLNVAGVHLSSLRMANLRPSAVRSFVERRWTTASTPLQRYYDHSRLVIEVQSLVRESLVRERSKA